MTRSTSIRPQRNRQPISNSHNSSNNNEIDNKLYNTSENKENNLENKEIASSGAERFIVNIITNIVHYIPLIDGGLFLFEFYLIVAIVGFSVSIFSPIPSLNTESCSSINLQCILNNHLIPILISLLKHGIWIYFVTKWFLWRHSVRLRRRFSFTLSRIGYYIVILNFIGFFFMITLQFAFGKWVYSFDNWIIYPYDKVVLFLFGSPVLEELLIRLILTMVFRRRTGDSVLWTILYTNFCFSSMHLWNQLSSASDLFTFIQAIIAFVIGCFYSTRYYVTGNIFEVIILHFMNNLSGMFVPLNLKWDMIYPYFILPFIFTLLSYLYFLWRDSKVIQSGKSIILPSWAKKRSKSS